MAEEPAQTALKMTTGGWELEVSVNMEKVLLKVYGETREERQTVCWIASEAGKAYSVTITARRSGPLEDHYYDRMTCQVHIDGQRCGSIWATQNPYTLESTRVDASRVREWVFAQPRLDEDDAAPRGPAQPDLGAITVTARRARAGASVMAGNYYKVQDAGSISEKTKKGILGAVTAYVLPHQGNETSKRGLTPVGNANFLLFRFREKQVAYTPPGIATQSEQKPSDSAEPMWTFKFNYAPEAVLQAQGRVPIKHKILEGGPGRSADAPIDLEDDAPRASSDQKPRIGASQPAAPADDPDAREAALLAELERLRNKKRKALESIELSDEENDSKAAVMRKIGKKLEEKKKADGGKVDLTGDSD